MGSVKSAGKGAKGREPAKRQIPKDKVDKFVEGAAAGKKGPDAVIDAGWNQTRKAARVTASRLLSNANILERVEERRKEAARRANIQTDVVIGSLAEIVTSSLADVIPEDEFMARARAMGTDHLVKKLRVKTRYYSNGPGKEPDKEVTHEFEMYSRLDALGQLCTVLGLNKKEAENPIDLARKALEEAEDRFPHMKRAVLAKLAAETYGVQESDLIQ